MSSPTEFEVAPEREKVILFKMQWLINAGFSPDNAELLASADYVDWHAACDAIQLKSDEESHIVKMFL